MHIYFALTFLTILHVVLAVPMGPKIMRANCGVECYGTDLEPISISCVYLASEKGNDLAKDDNCPPSATDKVAKLSASCYQCFMQSMQLNPRSKLEATRVNVQPIAAELGSKQKSVRSRIWGKVKKVGSKVKGVTKKVGSKVKSGAKQVVSKYKSGTKHVVSKAKGTVKHAGTKVTNTAKHVASKVKSTGNKIAKKLGNLF